MSTDSFDTAIPSDRLSTLLELAQEFHFDPLSSLEMEAFFVAQLAQYDARTGNFRHWITPILRRSFRYASYPPRWIQNPQWAVGKNGPMLFLGQVDCKPIEGVFHDLASVYVFFDPSSGEQKTVMQIA
ncbi:MAG: hypothetical protein ACKOFW_15680 [Planctomycetaceae bacterium]|jgi:hypothetical protein